jgi:hypothetical protein
MLTTQGSVNSTLAEIEFSKLFSYQLLDSSIQAKLEIVKPRDRVFDSLLEKLQKENGKREFQINYILARLKINLLNALKHNVQMKVFLWYLIQDFSYNY